MTPDQKARTARILGYICLMAGALDLVLALLLSLRDKALVGFPLLGSGVGAVTIGIIMLALARNKPRSAGS